MTWIQALVLGIVQGLTEYLPVSSTGHLILAQRLMGLRGGEAADAYAICIQAGAIVAVLGLYFHRVRQMFRGVLGRDAEGARLAVALAAAFLPAAVIGLLFEKRIKEYLFNLPAIAVAWFVGGLAILVVSRWQRRRGRGLAGAGIEALTVPAAVAVGFAQCLAMWPGTSRSLATILGGLGVGLSVAAAVEFSFLLGVVTLLAATAHDAIKHGPAMLAAYTWTSLGLGFVSAAFAAVLAVRWMVGYLQRRSLSVFGWYRLALAVIVFGFLFLGS